VTGAGIYPKATCTGPSALVEANDRADRWKQRYDLTRAMIARAEALAVEWDQDQNPHVACDFAAALRAALYGSGD
jgi:hypothetical protein